MLSDTLFDAVEGIEWYRRRYPRIYEDVNRMGNLLVRLDSVEADRENSNASHLSVIEVPSRY